MPRLLWAAFWLAMLPGSSFGQAVRVAQSAAPGAPPTFAPPVLRALDAQIQALQPSLGDAGAMAVLLVARAGPAARAPRAPAAADELASALLLKRALTQPASYAAVQRSLAADSEPLARSVAEGVRGLRTSILADRGARETFERAFGSLEGALKPGGKLAEVGAALDRFFEGTASAGGVPEAPPVRADRPLQPSARPAAAALEAFSTPAGQAEVAEALSRPDFEPARLLEALKRDPFLRGEYAKSAGVSEGYSLERHTLMVMRQFERYFPGELPGGAGKRLFRLTLALHDIGKPWAVERGEKSRQHERTVLLLERYLPRYGFSEADVRLAAALADGDPIGSWLQRKDLAGAVAKLRAMAERSGLARERFFELLLVYYMADAGSYTADAGGTASLDYLFIFDRAGRKLAFAPEVARRVSVLRDAFLKG